MAQNMPKTYSHKVLVDSVVQTKIYTYLKVRERINEKDSLQWVALPLIQAKTGDVFYFENGLPMGLFQSKELGRSFKQILFLSYVSTSLEVNEKTVLRNLFHSLHIIGTWSVNTGDGNVQQTQVHSQLCPVMHHLTIGMTQSFEFG